METKPTITYEDFAKLDIRIGRVVAAEAVEGSDKLIKTTVDFGDETRTIVSGLRPHKEPHELVGKRFPYIVNLAPRIIFGIESQGMILAVAISDGVALLEPDSEVSPGTPIS